MTDNVEDDEAPNGEESQKAKASGLNNSVLGGFARTTAKRFAEYKSSAKDNEGKPGSVATVPTNRHSRHDWLERLFDLFGQYAIEVNKLVEDAHLVTTCERPSEDISENPLISPLQGCVSTKYWQLTVRLQADGIAGFLLPMSMEKTFLRDESLFERIFLIESPGDENAAVWSFDNKPVEYFQLPDLAKRFFGSLIEIARMEDISDLDAVADQTAEQYAAANVPTAIPNLPPIPSFEVDDSTAVDESKFKDLLTRASSGALNTSAAAPADDVAAHHSQESEQAPEPILDLAKLEAQAESVRKSNKSKSSAGDPATRTLDSYALLDFEDADTYYTEMRLTPAPEPAPATQQTTESLFTHGSMPPPEEEIDSTFESAAALAAQELARVEAERMAAEKAELMAAAALVEAEIAEAAAAEEAALRHAEAEKIRAAEEARADAVRALQARAEEEARAEAARAEAARAEQARLEEAAKIELARLEQARLEEEARAELARVEQARLEEEARLELARVEQAKAEDEARLEAERAAQARAEEEARLEAERLEQARVEEEARLEAERAEQARAEEEARLEAEKAEQARAEEEARLEAERAEQARAEEKARLEAGGAEQARSEEEASAEADRTEQAKAAEEAKAAEHADVTAPVSWESAPVSWEHAATDQAATDQAAADHAAVDDQAFPISSHAAAFEGEVPGHAVGPVATGAVAQSDVSQESADLVDSAEPVKPTEPTEPIEPIEPIESAVPPPVISRVTMPASAEVSAPGMVPPSHDSEPAFPRAEDVHGYRDDRVELLKPSDIDTTASSIDAEHDDSEIADALLAVTEASAPPIKESLTRRELSSEVQKLAAKLQQTSSDLIDTFSRKARELSGGDRTPAGPKPTITPVTASTEQPTVDENGWRLFSPEQSALLSSSEPAAETAVPSAPFGIPEDSEFLLSDSVFEDQVGQVPHIKDEQPSGAAQTTPSTAPTPYTQDEYAQLMSTDIAEAEELHSTFLQAERFAIQNAESSGRAPVPAFGHESARQVEHVYQANSEQAPDTEPVNVSEVASLAPEGAETAPFGEYVDEFTASSAVSEVQKDADATSADVESVHPEQVAEPVHPDTVHPGTKDRPSHRPGSSSHRPGSKADSASAKERSTFPETFRRSNQQSSKKFQPYSVAAEAAHHESNKVDPGASGEPSEKAKTFFESLQTMTTRRQTAEPEQESATAKSSTSNNPQEISMPKTDEMSVVAAIEMMRHSVERELENVAEIGARAFQDQDMNTVERAMKRTLRIREFKEQLLPALEAWNTLGREE